MTDTRRRARGAGSVFRDKNGTWHYRRELDRDPASLGRLMADAIPSLHDDAIDAEIIDDEPEET